MNITKHFQIDRRFPHNVIKRAGGKLYFQRQGETRWLMFVHDDCDNGDGGVVYRFYRKRRGWKCYGFGRLRYCGQPERTIFADKLPAYGPRQVIRSDDGKWQWQDKASGQIIGEYIPPAQAGVA